MKTRIFACALSLVLGFASNTVRATNIVWTNTVSGNWNAVANWSPNQVPGSTDNAFITNSGTYTVTFNASATVASFTLGGASGTQTFLLNANTLTLSGASTVGNNGAFNLGGGTLGGAGSFAINGLFTWTNGTITSTGGVTLNGASSFTGLGVNTMFLEGVMLNAGPLTWGGSGNNLEMQYANFTNLASGTVTIPADVSVSSGYSSTFANAGVITKTGAGGTTAIPAIFVNTGTVAVQSGTFSFTGTSTQSGVITNSSGTTVLFPSGTHTVTAGFNATGPGSIVINGSATLNFNNAAGSSLPNLDLYSGTLGGTGPLAINGLFTWTNGTITSTGGVTLNGASSFTGLGVNTMFLEGVMLNAGPLTWGGSGNNLEMQYANFTNLASGTVTIPADVSVSSGYSTTIANAGIITKTGAGGTTAIPANFVNTGTVAVQSGTFSFTGTSTQSGVITNSSGTTVLFPSGTHTVTAGFNLTGPGSIVINGSATVNFNNAAGSSLPNLDLYSGTLGGTGPLAINGLFTWTNGTITSTGGVTLNGASSFTGLGVNTMFLEGVMLNAGPLTWGGSGNNLEMQYANFTNLASGTVTIPADVSVSSGYSTTIANAGIITKTGAGGTTAIPANFVNTGTVAVQSGTFSFTGTSTQSGIITNSSGTTVLFPSGTHTVTAGFNLTGPGSIVINGSATVNFNNAAGSSLPNLDLYSGTLGGTGPLAINGLFTWTNGTITSTGGVTLNGASSFTGLGVNTMFLEGVMLNAGPLTWGGSGNNLEMQYANFTNLASGTVTIPADVSVSSGYASTFANAGTITKTGTTGTTVIPANFVNTGILSAQSGNTSLTGSYSLAKGTLNFGISGVTNFGTISLSGAAALTGGLSANLIGGYIPNSTNLFPVLSYGSKTGSFTSTNLPFADAWQVNYSSTNTVLQVLNARPILTMPPNQPVNELTLLNATSTAVDLDPGPQTLTFSLVAAPGGMTINPATGLINWTPAQTQSPSTNTVLVSVTDNGTPSLSATNGFTVVVVEINVAPALSAVSSQTVNELAQLSVSEAATESNIHATTTGYGLISPPAGMTISPAGLITWTPSQTQSPATNTITVVATNLDSFDLVNPILTSTNSFTVVVREINVAPSLPIIPLNTVSDSALLTVNDAATNANIHAAITGYGLVSPPAGASISPSGVFTWTPSPAQSPGTNVITVVVTNTDLFDLVNPTLTATNSFTVIIFAPTLNPIANFTVNPGQTVSFTASATDNDSTRALTFTLGAAPATASINAASGVFSWRAPVSSAGSSNYIQVIVTANSAPSISVTQSFHVLVNALTSAALTAVSRPPAQFQMQVAGPIGPDYILQATGSLTNTTWSNLLTNTPLASPFTMTDPNASVSTNRFYRVLLGP